MDIVNGLFEIIGGFLCWGNVYALHKSRVVKGVYWPVQAFFAAWGLWNLAYYPHLGQVWSTIGALFLVSGNLTWVALAIQWREPRARREDMLRI